MEKIDLDATRKAILDAYNSIEPFPEDGPEQIAVIDLMKRSARMIAEVQVFCLQELERAEKAGEVGMEVFATIGQALTTALHSACASVHDAEPPPEDAMEAQHQAIHVLIDTLDKGMHELYYSGRDGSDTAENGYYRSEVTVVRKEVGDA